MPPVLLLEPPPVLLLLLPGLLQTGVSTAQSVSRAKLQTLHRLGALPPHWPGGQGQLVVEVDTCFFQFCYVQTAFSRSCGGLQHSAATVGPFGPSKIIDHFPFFPKNSLEFSLKIHLEIRSEICSKILPNICSEIHPNICSEICPKICSEIRSEMRLRMHLEMRLEMCWEMR